MVFTLACTLKFSDTLVSGMGFDLGGEVESRSKVAIAASAIMLMSLIAWPAQAQSAFKNCAQFNSQYPKGIARDVKAAVSATQRGYERPPVNKRLFAKAIAANKRLGSPRDGVLCEVRNRISPPSEVQNLTVVSTSETEVVLRWDPPANLGNSPILRYVVATTAGLASGLGGGQTRVTGLSPDTAYTFSISAVNAAGEGPPVAISATTATQSPAPAPPAAPIRRYSSCADARAAGVTPIRRDTNPELYAANRHLDRDGDGIACE